MCADGHVLGKHKLQSKKQLSDASSSDDEEPNYGKRAKYDDLSRATKERPAKHSSHHDRSSDRYKRSQSPGAEAERRRHKDGKEADDISTDQKLKSAENDN